MATVDELKLEFNSDGASKLIRELKQVDEQLRKASANIDALVGKTSNLGGVQDKNSKKKIAGDKKVAKEEVKTQKRTIESNKSLNSSLNGITKSIMGLASLSTVMAGIKFGLNQVDNAINTTSSLETKATASNADRKEVEAVSILSRTLGFGDNALTGLYDLFNDHKDKVAIGKGGNSDFIDMIALFNGNERNNLKIDQNISDFTSLIKSLNQSLLKENDPSRRADLARIISSNENTIALLLSKNLNSGLEKATVKAGVNDIIRKKANDNTSEYLDSEENVNQSLEYLGTIFTGLKTSINNGLASTINSMTGLTEKKRKHFESEFNKKLFSGLKNSEDKELGEKIIEINTDEGWIKTNDGRTYKDDGFGGHFFSDKDSEFLKKRLEQERIKKNIGIGKKTSSLLSPQVMDSLINDSINGSFLGASNNSNYNQNQVTNIEELHIHSAATNLDGIMADVSNQVKWTFNEVTTVNAMPYGRVIG